MNIEFENAALEEQLAGWKTSIELSRYIMRKRKAI